MKVFRYLNVLLFAVNISLFGLWWSMIRVDSIPASGLGDYFISQIGLQITILGGIVGVAVLILTALGFIGFQTVLERAEIQADKTAKEVVAKLADQGSLRDEDRRPRPSASLPDVGDTEEAKD